MGDNEPIPGIIDYINLQIKASEDKIKKNREMLKGRRKLLKDINSPDKYIIQVIINSSWSNEGEESAAVERKGVDLADVILEAEYEFKRINNRSDIQGSYLIYLKNKFGGIYLPEEFYKDFIEQNRK